MGRRRTVIRPSRMAERAGAQAMLDLDDGDAVSSEFFAHPPTLAAEPLWEEDELLADLWELRRARRRLVRTVGWLALVAMLAGIGQAARVAPGAGEAMLAWATMGTLGDAPGAKVRSVLRSLRR